MKVPVSPLNGNIVHLADRASWIYGECPRLVNQRHGESVVFVLAPDLRRRAQCQDPRFMRPRTPAFDPHFLRRSPSAPNPAAAAPKGTMINMKIQ